MARVPLYVDLGDADAAACINAVLSALEQLTKLVNYQPAGASGSRRPGQAAWMRPAGATARLAVPGLHISNMHF